jgi:hypothetical protein
MNKYQNGKIYKLVCDNSPLVYYGSTIRTLKHRLWKHQYDYKINRGKTSSILFDLGNVDIKLIKNFPCNSRNELLNEERLFIEVFIKCFPFKIICNKNLPIRNETEKIQDAKAQYTKIKIICECGGRYTKMNESHHRKSKKHLNFINSQ